MYDQQILGILMDVGDRGISVQLLSRQLYNLNVSLFSSQDLEEIRAYVQQYLLKNSKSPQSLIESTGRRGYYRLNTLHNADARQLMLEFKRHEQVEEKEEKPMPDLSLDLFA